MSRQKQTSSRHVRGLMEQNKGRNGFLQYLLESAEARETVKALLGLKLDNASWEGYAYVPAGSAVERIVKAFERETDIPLELPFHSFMFYFSGYLMSKGVRIEFGGRERTPELWTIVLAPSGAGKSFSAGIIAKASPIAAEFPECASGAKFLDAMAEHETAGKPMLWLQDEFAQKLKQIENVGSPMADIKDYLLRAYDGSKIERNTKSAGCTVVEKPCLGILGLNTDEGFFRTISQESLVDGFAQRFGFVVAQRDPKRPMRDFPIYNEKVLGEAVAAAYYDISSLPLHTTYRFGPTAEAAYCEAFRELAGDGDIPESFYRRVMFRTIKYALLYHLILGKDSDQIDAEDVAWASRLCRQQLFDARRMLAGSLGDIRRMLAAAERRRAKSEAEGKPLTARDIQRNVEGVNSAEDARGLLSLMGGEPALPKAA